MPGIQQLSCLCENGPANSSSEHRQLSCGLLALYIYKSGPFFVFGEVHDKYQIAEPVRGNYAVLRKSLCKLESLVAGRLAQR